MATVYSLVCFGGLSGKTVTFTDTGDVVNLANHGLRQGVTGVVFSTTGSLPTGITAGTTYYPRDGADANKFTIYPTKADAMAGTNQRTFTGTGSGTHTLKSAYMLGLTSEQLARYGSSGSERIYNGVLAWYSDRLASNLANVEICEVGECFDEVTTSYLAIAAFVAKMIITSKVNGVFSSAFHNGVVGAGYRLISSNTSQTVININMYYVDIVGIEVCRNSTTESPTQSIISQGSAGYAGLVDQCIINGMSTGGVRGILTGAGSVVSNNIILGCLGSTAVGLEVNTPQGSLTYNNLITKNTVGIKGSGYAGQGKAYNNVAVGNTINYSIRPAYSPTTCLRNVGQTTDLLDFTVTNGSSNLTFSVGHNVASATYTGICFQTTGTLPTVGGTPLVSGKMYWVRMRTSATVITISLTQGSAALVFDGIGSGTHYASAVWVTEDDPLMIDFSDPDTVFVDWDNNDFRLSPGSPLINAGVDVSSLNSNIESDDIVGDVRPNYEASTYPDNYWDCGPFEYDHGDGLAPQQVAIELSGIAEGSVMALYKTSDGTAIISPTTIGASGSYSAAYSYTGDTQIEVVVRKGTSGTKYLPYSAPGLITGTGFSLIVNQVVDGVLNG